MPIGEWQASIGASAPLCQTKMYHFDQLTLLTPAPDGPQNRPGRLQTNTGAHSAWSYLRAMSMFNVEDSGLNLIYAPVGHYKGFLRSPLCGAEPLVCPCSWWWWWWWWSTFCARRSRSLHLCTPSTPNKLVLTAVTLSSQGRAAMWPLAQAADQSEHAYPNCLGTRAAFQASLDPISTQ
jgi:hypothetical protein